MARRPDRLPPLTALRAFDAAARRMSFAQAAEELAVTPAALSYQIKHLEEHLGMPLFRRLNRAVELTEAGARLAPGVAEGFERLRAATRGLDALREDRGLTVTAGPAFTAKWLAPRVFSFVAAHPEVEVAIKASLRLMDFDRDGVDVAIRFGLRDDPGHHSERLITERMAPMCAPALAPALRRPQDMAEATLIQDESLEPLGYVPEFSDWLRAAGVEDPEDAQWRRGARFSNADHAISAATQGAGVVLGRFSMASAELRDGRLVLPFDLAIDPAAHTRFVCAKGDETRPSILAFRDWLRQEIADTLYRGDGVRVAEAPRLKAAAEAARKGRAP